MQKWMLTISEEYKTVQRIQSQFTLGLRRCTVSGIFIVYVDLTGLSTFSLGASDCHKYSPISKPGPKRETKQNYWTGWISTCILAFPTAPSVGREPGQSGRWGGRRKRGEARPRDCEGSLVLFLLCFLQVLSWRPNPHHEQRSSQVNWAAWIYSLRTKDG